MTKKELKAECKRLAETHIKRSLSEEERKWLIDNVLRHHPHWEWWENQGVKDIYADYNKEHYYSLGFWIVFADGTKADISYIKSIKNL